MAWQKGSTASIMLGFEATATYGTVATDGFVLPVNYGESLVGVQAINAVNTIRGNRNPNQGFRGARSVSGQIPVPVDSVCLPYWLAATFGDPTTTGSSPYVHEYKIADTQPSFTLEKAFTDLDTSRYLRFLGCKVAGFSIDVGGDGELVMNFDVAGAQDSWQTSAFDDTPTSPSLARLNMFDGAVSEGGSTSTIVTAVNLNVNLGLDTRPETISIGSSGIRTDMAEGSVTVSGTVTALFTDAGYTLLTKGVAGTESSLKLTFTGSTSSVFELELQELEYGRPGVPINTPEGILLELPFQAHYENGSEASVVVARITNATESYNLVT
jgi:hypothetical protein